MASVSFSSINVVNGVELGDTPQVSVQQSGKRSARGGDVLLIFLDLPNASSSTCADITRTLNDGFTRAPGGVTSALRLAIRLANDRVGQLNKGAPPNQRLEGSISCVLASEDGLVIAQAGPAIAYARSASGAFEGIEPYAEDAPQTVGVTPTVDVHFNNFTPQPGDVFVLTGARSLIGVTDRLVNACMAKGDARMVAGYLNANVKQGRMTGIVISVDGGAGGSLVTPHAEPTRSAAAPLAAETATTVATMTRTVPTAAPATAPVPQPAGPSAVSQMAEGVMIGVNQAAKSMQRSLSAFGNRLLPQESPAEMAQRSRTTTFILMAIAVLLPIIIGVAVVVGYMQFSGEADRMQLRSTAQAQVQAAGGVADPNQAKTDWGKALQLIADYEAKNPEDTATFSEAKGRARTELDRISQVTRIQPLMLTQMDGSAARRVAASALGVYVLNPESNTAEYYVLNPERTGTTGKKVQITFTDGVTQSASSLADVAWATTNGDRWRTEGAVMFDTSSIFEYSSATGRAAPIAIPANADATPLKVQAGELFNNTVYLLDTGVGQVWRYPLAGDGLGEGNSYFRSPYNPLKESVDFGIDGAIYVLQKNGAILKYYNRQPVQFTVAGLPEPIKRATAIAVGGPDQFRGSLYVLDAENGSVIELSKTGQFVRQYRGPNDEFLDAQDISFDGTSNTLYVSTRDQLFSFPVQPLPAPPQVEETPTAQP